MDRHSLKNQFAPVKAEGTASRERTREAGAEMIDLCRADPDGTTVRWRFNNNPWHRTSGREFLELWDQPLAGTIDLDWVVGREQA